MRDAIKVGVNVLVRAVVLTAAGPRNLTAALAIEAGNAAELRN
jgi:hypothetical protein